jgi:hypothetical protein
MRIFNFLIGILLILVMISCTDVGPVRAPAGGEDQSLLKSSVSIKMSMAGASTEIASIMGILTRAGYDTLKCNFVIAGDSATGVFSGIPTGKWHLRVNAYDASRTVKYSGETDVDVNGGVTTPVNLTLDPATGSIAITVTWGSSNRSNRALEFDGISGYVEVFDSPSLTNFDTTITIEAWIKPGDTRYYNYIVCKGFSDLEYSLELIDSPLHPAVHIEELKLDATDASEYWGRLLLRNSLSVGTWTHLAVAYQSGKGISIYINGLLVLHSNSTGKISHVAGNLRMGVLLNDTYALFYKGAIDEVRIWSVARTADQIAANMRKELVGNEAGLAGYWNFNDSTGTTTIRDGSSYGNKGILHGGVHFTTGAPF